MISKQDFWGGIATLTYANETEVETKLLAPLLEQLGYDPNDHVAWRYPVVFQEGRSGRKPEADIVVFSSRPHGRNTSLIVIEAKAPSQTIEGGKEQGESYATNLKAPLLIICNGVQFELWQLQPTQSSQLVLDCTVLELPGKRAEIEQLLSRQAVVAYAETLVHKALKETLDDLSAYEDAELERSRQYAFTPRRAQAADGRVMDTEAIASWFENGAVIFAPSGYGKSQLANHLTARAIEARISGAGDHLPIGIFLPDAPPDSASFRSFLIDRIAPHSPQVTDGTMTGLLKGQGLALFADGFDRVPVENRQALESTLALLCRDYPKTRLHVFSRPQHRPQRLALPSLDLLPLSEKEQFEFCRDVVNSDHAARAFLREGTSFLKSLWSHPLLLDLTLQHYLAHHEMPTRVETVFESWLARLLPPSMPAVSKLGLRDLMTLVAEATVFVPLSRASLLEIARDGGFTEANVQSLFEHDALFSRDGGIELQHEALADYLRADALARRAPDKIRASLRDAPVSADSTFAPLLMALASTPEKQEAVWSEIVAADMKAAMVALRYRADTTASQTANVSRRFLSELLEAIELPLKQHFPQVATKARAHLGGPEVVDLGVRGDLESASGQLSYEFFALSIGEPRVQEGALGREWIMHGKSLGGLGYRLDSGRLIGMTHLRDCLLGLVEACRVDGSTLWAEERTVMRLLDFADRYRIDWKPGASLKEVRKALSTYAGRWMGSGGLIGGRPYPMQELLDDLSLLIERKVSLDERLYSRPPNEHELQADPERLQLLLARHYERTQLLVREVVETSFPELSHLFPHYSVMPIRFDVRVQHDVDRHGFYSPTTQATWTPVGSWSEAGVDVAFVDQVADLRKDDPWPSTLKALKRLGRDTDNTGFGMDRSFSLWSYLTGSAGLGDDRHASSSLRAAKEALTHDIKHLFAELPDRDQTPDRLRRP